MLKDARFPHVLIIACYDYGCFLITLPSFTFAIYNQFFKSGVVGLMLFVHHQAQKNLNNLQHNHLWAIVDLEGAQL